MDAEHEPLDPIQDKGKDRLPGEILASPAPSVLLVVVQLLDER